MLQKLHYLYASCTLSFFYILTSQLSHTVSIAIGVWWKCLCVEALCFRLPVCPPAFSTASECKAVCESSCPGECRLHLNEWPIESPFCALESFVQTLEALRRSPSVCLRVFFFFLLFIPHLPPPILHFLRSISFREQNCLVFVWESPNRLMKLIQSL